MLRHIPTKGGRKLSSRRAILFEPYNDFFLLRRLDLPRSDCQLRLLHYFLFAFMGIHIFTFDTTGRLFGA